MQGTSENNAMVLGVFTCPKYKNREIAVRDTWFKKIPENCIALFVVSDEGKRAKVEKDVLYLDCPEGYEFLPVKTYHFVKYCLEHYEFEYIFKADDDAYVNMSAFAEFRKTGDYIGRFVGRADKDFDRTWHYGKFENPALEKPFPGEFISSWAAGGDGYFLSKKAATVFVQNAIDTVEAELIEPAYCGYEDKMVGDVLSTDPGLVKQNASLGAFGAIHPVNPIAMRMIHAQFTR